jgi:hypothetical protein
VIEPLAQGVGGGQPGEGGAGPGQEVDRFAVQSGPLGVHATLSRRSDYVEVSFSSEAFVGGGFLRKETPPTNAYIFLFSFNNRREEKDSDNAPLSIMVELY